MTTRLVELEVDERYWPAIELLAKHGMYFGPEDYLNGLLNTAILHDVDELEEARHAATIALKDILHDFRKDHDR